MNTFFNVRHAAYAEIDSESKAEVTYKNVTFLAPVMDFNESPQSNSTPLYGNGIEQANAVKSGAPELNLGLNYMSLKDEAVLTGHRYIPADDTNTNEAIERKSSDQAPYVGVGTTIDCEDGTCMSTWYYKVKFEESEKDVKQSEDSYEFSTPSIKGKAVTPKSGLVSKSVVWTPASPGDEPNYKELFNLTANATTGA